MGEIEYREYRPEDGESFLRLHDSTFPAMPEGYWQEWSQGPVTASVAILDGEVVGAVPFHFRDFRLRPDAVARVAWEYSVCVRADLRGKGVGSGLMRTAKQFLRGRCLAMMVYREDERSPAYRYYAANGHHDAIYLRSWVRGADGPAPTADASAPVRTVEWERFPAEDERYLDVFGSAYASHGGYPPRGPGYYRPATNTPQYREIPLALGVLELPGEEGLRGYLVAGEERLNPALHLMEVATRHGDLEAALLLLSAYAGMARQRGLPAVASMPDASPYAPLLAALGFRPTPRAMMVMAHALDPEGLARAAWRRSEATAHLEVTAWTPERRALLHRPDRGGGRPVTLEMKEATLTRLLLSRLDLSAAVAEGSVTVLGGGPAEVAAIAQALPFSEWAYHHLDFI